MAGTTARATAVASRCECRWISTRGATYKYLYTYMYAHSRECALVCAELECQIFASRGTGVSNFCCVGNWSARFLLCVELECHIFVACGTGVPDFCFVRNWTAMCYSDCNCKVTSLPKFRTGGVDSGVGTGVPNWSAKCMWHSSSRVDTQNNCKSTLTRVSTRTNKHTRTRPQR